MPPLLFRSTSSNLANLKLMLIERSTLAPCYAVCARDRVMLKTPSEASLGSDNEEYPECLESQSRRPRVRDFTKRMFRKLLG